MKFLDFYALPLYERMFTANVISSIVPFHTQLHENYNLIKRCYLVKQHNCLMIGVDDQQQNENENEQQSLETQTPESHDCHLGSICRSSISALKLLQHQPPNSDDNTNNSNSTSTSNSNSSTITSTVKTNGTNKSSP
jgi:hypothetical protein